MAEFEIVATSSPGKVSIQNYNELYETLKNELKTYDYEVSAENERSAKADRAKLNKFASAINERRIEIRRDYESPLLEFEQKCNTLRDMAREASLKIDVQVKALEEKQKQEKRKVIEEYYDSIGFDLVPLDAIFDKRWLNKTNSTWSADIDRRIDIIRKDMALLEKMYDHVEGADSKEAQAIYLECLDLTETTGRYEHQIRLKKDLKKREDETKKDEAVPKTEPQLYIEREPEVKTKKHSLTYQRAAFRIEAPESFFVRMNELLKEYRNAGVEIRVAVLEKREDI